MDRLCREVSAGFPARHRPTVDAIRARLHEPVRVAIAGRAKAGKSTLLNALIGERLAPTDAGECTRIITWYRHAPGYTVTARTETGANVSPSFRRGEHALEIDLGGDQQFESLHVGWPSRRLSEVTYIDTPGLGSLTPSFGDGARRLLGVETPEVSQADAVIYLLRHAHAEDVHFLEGFRDTGLPMGSPLNTVAVLSRADEIGGGRLDALDSARKIAGRYLADDRVRGLAAAIVPLSGLLAETAATLEEMEYACLRQVAAAAAAADDLLLSVDRFRDSDASPLAAELRERILVRFGLFGIRFCVRAIQNGAAPTSQALANLLLEVSGMNDLRAVLRTQFTSRARTLVARTALAELLALTHLVRSEDAPAADRLAAAVEATLGSAHEFAQLEVLHEAAIGAIAFSGPEREEAERLAAGDSVNDRLDLAPDAPVAVQQQAVLRAIERWRRRGSSPLTDRATQHACEVMARSYEHVYTELQP